MTAAHDTQALAAELREEIDTQAGTHAHRQEWDRVYVLLDALASRLQEQEGRPALSALLERAAWICECYAEFIRSDVMSADIERHPYLPEIEGTAEDLRATLAAGSQAVQVPGWRPIDSAPKDGSQIDVWIGDEREPDVFWGTPKLGHREPCWCRHTYDPYWGWVPESVGTPSHWMPKPLQPLAGGEVQA